ILLLRFAQIYKLFMCMLHCFFFFFSSRRRHTRFSRDWSSDVCSSDLAQGVIRFPNNFEISLPSLPPQQSNEQLIFNCPYDQNIRSEERRVGKECRYMW